MTPSTVILYSTTFAATLKVRSDITKIKHILDSKKIPYDDVDLSEQPHRRVDMLKYSDNNHTLPQLHVNNRFIGSADDIQELEDWGELEAILRGVSPGKLAAESAAAAQAEALAYSASLSAGVTLAAAEAAEIVQPSFSPPPSIPPALEGAVEKAEVETLEQEENEELCTTREVVKEIFKKLESEPEEQQEEEDGGKVRDEVVLPALDLENSEYKDIKATEVEIVEKLEQQEVVDSSPLLALPATAEDTCYFSPVLIKANSENEEETKDNGVTPTTTEPEFVVVQANFQDLDLSKPPKQQHQDDEEPPSPLSSITPSPSPSPYKQEVEEQTRELDHTLEVNPSEDQQRQQQSPSPVRPLEAHPLGDAVHAHAVQLVDPLGHTSEDEEYIFIDNFTSAISSPDILPFEEEEEEEK